MTKRIGTYIELAQFEIIDIQKIGIEYPPPSELGLKVLANEIERRDKKLDQPASD